MIFSLDLPEFFRVCGAQGCNKIDHYIRVFYYILMNPWSGITQQPLMFLEVEVGINKIDILQQLSIGNRIILPIYSLILFKNRSYMTFRCYCKEINNKYYIWISNDERR